MSSDDLKSINNRKYGWVNEDPDDGDLKLINKSFFKGVSLVNFPYKLELEDLPDIYEQGELGSCTSNAISTLYKYEIRNHKKKSPKILNPVGCSYITTKDS